MVLKRFFGRTVKAPSATSVPAGIRAYAIGDVHGRLDLLDQLMAAIDADTAARGPAETHLVFLGDLIDRGANSAGVVERVRLLAATRPNVTVLAGNHEEVFLRVLGGDAKSLRFFTRIGGHETILSYGVDRSAYDRADYAELHDLVAERVPIEHVAFLKGMREWVTIGDYLFVHAGIRPGIAIEEQDPTDLRWIRGDFLGSRVDHGVVVVHGHTPMESVDWQDNRIGIDTGAWETGRLTALGLEGNDRWLIDTGGANAAAV